MSVTLPNVWPFACHVYIAKRSDVSTPVAHATSTGWKDVGAYKAGSGKFVGEESTYETQIGKHPIAKMLGFEVSGLETDDTKISDLETMENSICDVLLVPVNNTSEDRMKLLAVIPRLLVDGGFDGKDPAGVKLRCEGVYNKVSNFKTRITGVAWRL